ncbi:GNAT family N-acetyltransferase [Methylobacter sp. Wu1]|uniref:GNAT family N-acetyltransferase n=1 Tax=Methylobacter sp. Wu1 TaxID=3119359 RepID=UPI002F94C8BA
MITIRTATSADVEQMVELLSELFAIEADFVFDRDKQVCGLRQLLESGKDRVFVAESGKHVVGMCSVQTLISTAEGGPVGLLEDLIVTAAFRRQGIGEKLLAAAVDWAERQGFKRLQLLADKNNLPALAFYEKQAWCQTQLICLRKC